MLKVRWGVLGVGRAGRAESGGSEGACVVGVSEGVRVKKRRSGRDGGK